MSNIILHLSDVLYTFSFFKKNYQFFLLDIESGKHSIIYKKEGNPPNGELPCLLCYCIYESIS